MSTEFLYREKDRSGCERKSYSLLSPGGFMSGPRTLRPERLQWLTTSAVNRQAFIRNTLWSLTVGPIARAAPNRSIYEVDTVRSGALEELAFRPKTLRFRKVFDGFGFCYSHLFLSSFPRRRESRFPSVETQMPVFTGMTKAKRKVKHNLTSHPSRAFAHSSHQNSDRRKARQKPSPPIFFFGAAMS